MLRCMILSISPVFGPCGVEAVLVVIFAHFLAAHISRRSSSANDTFFGSGDHAAVASGGNRLIIIFVRYNISTRTGLRQLWTIRGICILGWWGLGGFIHCAGIRGLWCRLLG